MPLPVSVLMPVPHDHAYFLMPLSVCQAWRTLFSLANLHVKVRTKYSEVNILKKEVL